MPHKLSIIAILLKKFCEISYTVLTPGRIIKCVRKLNRGGRSHPQGGFYIAR